MQTGTLGAAETRIIYDPACAAYEQSGHPEQPDRVIGSYSLLQDQTQLPLSWCRPELCADEPLLRVHTPDHLARLQEPREFDADTPWYDGISEHARRSASAALTGLDSTLSGQNAFSLMRPPGHHATRTKAMGFCYLNNAAIAVMEALARGCRQVAVFDFDVHHGNGTEAVLTDVPRTAFASVHQFPCYPDTGIRNIGSNCYNYPVPPQTPRAEYRQVLSDALEHVVSVRPELLVVSAGFDAYVHDPLAQETLEIEDFQWLGGLIQSVNVPVLTVLEGGYSPDLPKLILAYLTGLSRRA